MSSKDATTSTDTLPAIPKTKHGLVEAGRRSTHSAHCFEDSGLDLRESLASGLTSRQESAGSRAGSARSPPGLLVKAATVPLSPRPRSPLRKSLEYVRLSRSELDRKDQAVNSLRAENIQLQMKIRELESCKECYTVLQSACNQVSQILECSTEGVAAESVKEILTGKVAQLNMQHQQTLQRLSSCRSELEGTKGELSAANVKVSSLESRLEQGRETLVGKEAQIRQLRSELERVQQSSARTSSTLQSLRQQLAEAEDRKQSSGSSLAELQTEIGRLRKELKDKDDSLKTLELQISAKQAEQESLQERTTNSDAAYADLCFQLASVLQLESTNSFDGDYLLSQVCSLAQECSELRMRVETMTKTIKTAELDSKASRETILRLVSEAKNHEKNTTRITELQQAQEELKAAMLSLERERDSLQERLAAVKETNCALDQELQAREARLSELSGTLQSLRLASESERDVIESANLKFEEFCKGVATLVGAHSTDSITLLQKVEQLVQDAARREEEEASQTSHVRQLQSEQGRLQEQLVQMDEALEREGAKVKQLEGELVTVNLVKQGMSSEIEKHKSFYRKLAKSLQLDAGTAEILSGEFAEEAILVKTEQLTRHETQALAERQSAVYSLQRKLKACRQGLESRELHMGLLQKKVASLEERLQTYSHQESDWETATEKMKRLERQLKQMQGKVVQQRDCISQLKADNLDVQRLRSQCAEQEGQIAHLTASVEELTQARVQQARQLAKARQRAHVSTEQERNDGEGGNGEREMAERLKGELKVAQCELERAKEREQQLCVFKTAVQRLLRTEKEDDGHTGEETPTDYDLVARLEGMSAAQKRHKEMAKCLEASLKQLELGFKTGYNDALTLLSSDT